LLERLELGLQHAPVTELQQAHARIRRTDHQ